MASPVVCPTYRGAAEAGPLGSTGFCDGQCCDGTCELDVSTSEFFCCAHAGLYSECSAHIYAGHPHEQRIPRQFMADAESFVLAELRLLI